MKMSFKNARVNSIVIGKKEKRTLFIAWNSSTSASKEKALDKLSNENKTNKLVKRKTECFIAEQHKIYM
jgi:hypothetical protein